MVHGVVLLNSIFSCPVVSLAGFLTLGVVENTCMLSQIINSISFRSWYGNYCCECNIPVRMCIWGWLLLEQPKINAIDYLDPMGPPSEK